MTAAESVPSPGARGALPVPHQEPGAGTVQCEAVSVAVPRRSERILRDVDLEISSGEQVLILGTSGSGKSTLLRCLSGVIPHSVNASLGGTVRIGEVDTSDTSVVELSRVVGVMSQDPASSVALSTVEQEVALPLENRAVEPRLIDGMIDGALEVVQAGALRRRDTSTLSGGQVQRVALAATLVADPGVLLLDEPTSMLDPAGVRSVRSAIDRAVRTTSATVILVEHRLDEFAGSRGISGLPDRTVVLGPSGDVQADGPTAQVLAEHASALQGGGCWLPLESELAVLTGATGGLGAAENREYLRALAGTTVPEPANGGEVLLSASGVSVVGGGAKRPSRWGRSRADGGGAILAGVDLTLNAGEVVALLGANGTGKTSLLLTLAGLQRPGSGVITGDRPGMVFQNPEYQFLADRVDAEIGAGQLDEDVVRRALRAHRLEHLAKQSPYRLSGGEKRRLSLAAMLAHADRRTLLADEPTFGLDRRDTVAAARALRSAADEGRGVCIATHDLRLAATWSDRVVVLGDGGVLADGRTGDVLADSALMARSGLEVPHLVQWLLSEVGSEAMVSVLRALDGAAAGDGS